MNLLEWFQMEYPELVRKMRECSHHYDSQTLNPYHFEGDIWTHTLLVHLLAVRNYPDNIVLHLATLLHDVGKPVTFTNVDRIRFTSHETVGADMAEAICQRLAFSNEDTQRIVSLVKGHMRFMCFQKMKKTNAGILYWKNTNII